MLSSAYQAPGRLGDPSRDLGSDPRVRPALSQALRQLQLDKSPEAAFPDLNNMAELEAICAEAHNGSDIIWESLPNDLPSDATEPAVEQSEIVVPGLDGNELKLYVFKQNDGSTGPKPAVVYIHGGGMTVFDALMKPFVRWAKSLAILGTVAIVLDFRNAWAPNGLHRPFPAGLNDCVAGVKYIHAHRFELGISKLVLQGESGGANLCLATAIRANREGWIKFIDGVYGLVPYVSGAYAWPEERQLKELPSLKENDGYFLTRTILVAMSKFYSPGEGELENPLAWPYHASEKDLKGLPPIVLSMDELDPLRDEGIALFRKLLAAGVRATGEVNLGTSHSSAVIFRQAVQDEHEKALRHIVAFAKSLQ